MASRGLAHAGKRPERAVSAFRSVADGRILAEGNGADALLVITRGPAGVSITAKGGRRGADVHAREPAMCCAASAWRLRVPSAKRPNISITILSNVVASLSRRLRHANPEIRSLE
jgi:glutaminase